jgi:hypothetical protein
MHGPAPYRSLVVIRPVVQINDVGGTGGAGHAVAANCGTGLATGRRSSRGLGTGQGPAATPPASLPSCAAPAEYPPDAVSHLTRWELELNLAPAAVEAVHFESEKPGHSVR